MQNYVEPRFSRDELFIKQPYATYFMKSGECVSHWGTIKDSQLVVDKARTPVDVSLVIVELEGALRLCRLSLHPVPTHQAMGTHKTFKNLREDELKAKVGDMGAYCCNDMSANEFDDIAPF
ncbi:LexA family transcriptional regulator [Pantoea cypripedii]|uniref:DNA polymerase V n=1 Tax=Pantoea cypripedii TaxID=55209 RepID=A0A6B9GGL3_PANCY|nr:LexA family transcriptional regulator [Pantoea cypripedii]QGY33049.1 DNA polymerase V [Pantoea cypripedii]